MATIVAQSQVIDLLANPITGENGNPLGVELREPTVLDIASDDDPHLRIRAEEVKDIHTIASNAEMLQLAVDMIATMKAANGIGLAAPQIRRSVRLIVFFLPATRDDVAGVGVPLTVLFNPELSLTPFDAPSDQNNNSNRCCTEKVKDFEGCLSVPGMRGKVSRAKKIYYRGYDAKGERIDRVAEGWCFCGLCFLFICIRIIGFIVNRMARQAAAT
jgi:peptide deformylase